MNTHPTGQGIALICSPDGIVQRVLRDELGLISPMPPGTALADLVAGEQSVRVDGFLDQLRQQAAVFDWEMRFVVNGQPVPLHCAGAFEGGHLLVMAARTRAQLVAVNEELMLINNEQTNALRAALKELSLQRRERTVADSRLYDDLSRLNNELTNLQREMVRKNSELERLNEQKNRFLGMAAHDLRTPLGIILSYSEFLEAEAGPALNEEQNEFIRTIKETSHFMLRLVDDLLDVTTIESGRLQLDRVRADLGGIIRHNLHLNRPLATRKNISLKETIPADLPLVEIDCGKMEQVLNNLVSNAVKFSHEGTTVQVSVRLVEEGLEVAVRDEGQGIPPEDLPKLFKAFSKTSVRGTAGEPSTGLGLAIVRRIIEGHGGRIWVESTVGKGSTFHFHLPIATAPANA